AQSGLRYTNFHTTALCSPTRAALITGRNHHSVGFGVITEISNGFPGYDSIIPKDSATIGRILRDNGYATSWFGKNHNTPTYEGTQLGPFDQWPIGMGFEYFYGFLGGDVDQWAPGSLHRNTTPITPWLGHPGWNLTTAMADDAIQWLNRINDLDPSRRFLLYYAPGGAHAPHNPTAEWTKKAEDMHLFDAGWNKLRDTIFANEKRLGVIPQDAKLTPWRSDLIKNWDQLTADEKKLFIRQADVYAAYLMYTDHEIGRVIQAVGDLGKLDNTLIIYISGDNGASAEGSATGTPNEVLPFNGVELPATEQMKWYDSWGTDRTCPHYSIGWAWALDTPFKWTKQIPSFFGGTRNGMAISWPGHITDAGGIRNQFGHVIDIVPTILEVTGIAAPQTVDGFKQKPIEGVSLASTFDKAKADAPSPHKIQYFEMGSVQGLYDEGWMLSAVPIRAPWELAVKAIQDPAKDYKFELYDLNKDWTQNSDVAAAHPDKVKQMHELMFAEFKKYQVFPLDGSAATRFLYPRPSFSAGRTVFNYSGETTTSIPDGAQPSLLNTSYTISADVEVPAAGADGMLVCEGGRFGGYGLYLLKNKPVFTYNLLTVERVRWEGAALGPGRHTIVFDFKYDGLGGGTLAYNNFSGIGRGGKGTLSVDGTVVATKTIPRTIPILMPFGQTFNIGSALDSPLDDNDYTVPFPFTGKINKLKISVEPPKLTPHDIEKLKEAEMKAEDAK
ncbi:MAG TPA: sulfatase-like hydrolase/transferase, partial [Bryobacteraceae bacterium]